MAFSDAQIRAAMANPGASGPGGIYNQIRASMAPAPSGGGGGGGGGAAPAPAAPAPALSLPDYGGGQGQWATVNGPRTVPQMASELASAGYNGPTDPGSILMAYQRTTGGSVGPTSAAPGVFSTAVAPSGYTVPQTVGGQGLSRAQIDFLNAQGTMTQKELDERKRQFDVNLEWTKQMWEQQGLPQLVIAQKEQQLRQDEFAFEQAMAQRQQAVSEAGLTGTFQGGPTLQAQQQAFAQGMAQQQAALNAIQTAAQMGGPSDWLALSNYARGVRQTEYPQFIRDLLTGTGAPAATIGAGVPAAQSFAGLANRLGAGGTSASTEQDQLSRAVAMGRQLFGQGGAALAPQALEGLSPDELKMLQGLASASGGSMDTFMKQYSASRIGQGAAQAG